MSVPAFGDFVKLIELANEVYRRFMDAPEQFQALSDEVKGLEAVLGNVKSILSKRELTSKQTEVLVSIFVGCQNVLTPMNTKLEKYQGIEPHKKDSDIQNMRVKFRTAWKKVNWDAKEVQELRGRLTSNISLLNVFYADLNSQAISKIHVHQENQNLQTETAKAQAKRREILDWLTLLTPVNYTTQQDDFIRRRQEHTGEWLLGSSEFQTWFRNKNQTLFCPGIPGAGKTIMTSIVVDNLHSSLKKGDNIGISCIYCNFRRHHEQKPEDLLSSILRQLVEGQPVIPDEIEILYSHLKDIRARPSLKQILTVLQAVILTFSKTFIIVDALDECQISDGGRQKFLTALFNLQVQTESNIFATSRYIPEITARFASAIRVEIRATDEDVRRYVDGRLPELPPFVSRNPNLQEHVKSVLVEAVEGMFLLVDLHFSSLVGKKSAKALKTTLKTLPRGSDAYDRSYDDIMGRIKGQVGDYQQLAMESLSWITKTKRPLTATELQFALAIEIGEPRFDEENIPELEDIISVCAGLVTVDEKSRIIRLVHYTTQDYFERTWKTWFPDAHTLITNALVTYISMDARHGLESIFWHFSHSRPLFDLELYPYALKYWGKHARLALESKLDPASTWEEVKEPILNFLQKEKSLKAASRFAAVQSESTGRHARFRIGILFAAYFGLEHAVTTLFELGQDITVVDDTGRTPLYYAARNGHHIVVDYLIKTGVDLSRQRCDEALSTAAVNGHPLVVALLLASDEVDVNIRVHDSYGVTVTPLSGAARAGHLAVVNLFLADQRVDVNARDSKGRTPLAIASRMGHLAMVKLFLAEQRVDVNSFEQFDITPLGAAVQEGGEAVVNQLLADPRVNQNAHPRGSMKEAIPLVEAIAIGDEAIVKRLLADGRCAINGFGYGGKTPLEMAVENGNVALVQLLLANKRINVNGAGTHTALGAAVYHSREATVKLFLTDPRVDVNAACIGSSTPLGLAAESGNENIAELLLADPRIEVNALDLDGCTPLHKAAERGQGHIMKLLLEVDSIDVNVADSSGQTALGIAARTGYQKAVKLLLAKAEIDVNAVDLNGRTPLALAATSPWRALEFERPDAGEAVVKLLLTDERVQVNAFDSAGQTPLGIGLRRGTEEVVKLLLADERVDVNAVDSEGRSPLTLATSVPWLEQEKEVVMERWGYYPNEQDDREVELKRREGREAVIKLLSEDDRVIDKQRSSQLVQGGNDVKD